MLFNSYEFLFLFLPLAVTTFYLLGRRGYHRTAILSLVVASLVFYSWWNPVYLALIAASIVVNYNIGVLLAKSTDAGRWPGRRSVLTVGVVANLAALGYFKYANFFLDNLNEVFGTSLHLQHVVLPLAISFFTFQQIAYLVDAYRQKTAEASFLNYSLFVTFFPQLIAGPIVHHKEMLPQFASAGIFTPTGERLAVGATVFIIGLIKKVVIADGLAAYSDPVFAAAADGASLSFFEAWGGSLAYSFQLYFDFSGYSDMAVGLARLFGIHIAINFLSPFKAVNIVDFWRRWHITLSRFLRDYLYIPLGGNRQGPTMRYRNLMVTMVLGGLWHGAGWTFLAWGALHGIYLAVNHAWRRVRAALGQDLSDDRMSGRITGRVITFLAVVTAFVFFRAESFGAAVTVLDGMRGVNGFVLPDTYRDYLDVLFGFGGALDRIGWQFNDGGAPFFKGSEQLASLGLAALLVWAFPNTYQIMRQFSLGMNTTGLDMRAFYGIPVSWRPSRSAALLVAAALAVVVILIDTTSEFLYFQF